MTESLVLLLLAGALAIAAGLALSRILPPGKDCDCLDCEAKRNRRARQQNDHCFR